MGFAPRLRPATITHDLIQCAAILLPSGAVSSQILLPLLPASSPGYSFGVVLYQLFNNGIVSFQRQRYTVDHRLASVPSSHSFDEIAIPQEESLKDGDVVVDLILSNGRQAQALMVACRGAAGRVVALSSQDVYRAFGILVGLEPGPPQATPLTEESELRTRLGVSSTTSRPRSPLRLTIDWERAHPPTSVDPAQFDDAAEDAALAELDALPS
jgi:hypothetical protein